MPTSRRHLLWGAAVLTGEALLAADPAAAYYRRRYAAEPQPKKPARVPNGPVVVIVSIGAQKLWVYDKDGLFESTVVSTGTGGFPTPTGVFAILEKSVRHFSNIYGGASMPYMQRLTMSGVALHAGVVTGRPASHGCIRLPAAFAPEMYQMTGIGTRVIVMSGEAKPEAVEHANLFVAKRLPAVKPEEIAEAGPKARAIAATTGQEIEGGVMLSRIGSITAWRRGELLKLPISVFVSRAESRLYVRHGFSPLFDAPVKIREAERPLGTHVYTALELKGESGEMRWSAVTNVVDVAVQRREEQERALRQRARMVRGQGAPAALETAALAGPASDAKEALDRMEIADDVRARINDLIGVGATLIISDEGTSHEMRVSGTDFVVLTR